jgi:acylphosphatase
MINHIMSVKTTYNKPDIFEEHCMDADATQALIIHIRGLVQGVGFRPFVYRTASGNGIEGWVKNTTDGVHIKAVGTPDHLSGFIKTLPKTHPL